MDKKLKYFSMYIIIVVAVAFACSTHNPNSSSQSMNTYQVKKSTNKPDPDWKEADVLTRFSYPWEDATPPETSFQAMYDDDKFYFRYEVTDLHMLTYVDTNDKMEVVNSERVEIFFRVDEKLETYYCLEMDPLGRVLDYKAHFYRNMEFDWEWPANALNVNTQRTEKGYRLDGSITLESLKNLGILKGNKMVAGLYRGHCVKLEGTNADLRWISWIDPKTPEPDFHVASSFGIIQFVK